MDNEYQDLTDEQLQEDRMELEASIVKLGNLRSQNPSREDALAGYEAFIALAYKEIADGLATQAASCKAVGRVGSDTVEWRLTAKFCTAREIIRDHEGEKAQLAAINALEFGRDHAEIQAEHKQKREKIGRILAELARREAVRATTRAQAVYEDAVSKISGGN